MDWPAYSPDLNPIEHVWDALWKRIAARLHHPENTQQLKQMLIEEWALLPQEMLHQLILSMRRRCEATIASERRVAQEVMFANSWPTLLLSSCRLDKKGQLKSVEDQSSHDGVMREVPAQMSSSSLGHGTKLHCDSGYLSTTEKLSPRRIRAHYEQLSGFERGRIIKLKEAGWANRRNARPMGRSDAAVRRWWLEWVDSGRFLRHDGSGRPMTTADREDRLIARSAVKAPDSSLSTIKQATRIRLFKHFLGQSDFSPIEHVWDMMGRRMHAPRNVEDLASTIEANLARNTAGDHQVALSLDAISCGIQGRGESTP
ncbi:uncharacterized protein TNCV_1090051 [Trichonephila clavipes]|uniref:Tc1-like transposase DDE domain-containing protein n=1 Tax=Trichonephila clavipes TaxID=2585209 RepID=A0A8X6VQG1_TRICX|nr:uncharacterized protein TNCV_1090051 [Trichonephila clavipes]